MMVRVLPTRERRGRTWCRCLVFRVFLVLTLLYGVLQRKATPSTETSSSRTDVPHQRAMPGIVLTSVVSSLDAFQPTQSQKLSTTNTTICNAKGCWRNTQLPTTRGSQSPPVAAPVWYWNYHAVLAAHTGRQSSRILELRSIDSRHRLPPIAYENVTAFLDAAVPPLDDERWWRSEGTKELLFTYNPSIVILPECQQQQLGNVCNSSTTAVYLASFRVSNQNYCFHPYDRQRLQPTGTGSKRMTGTNHLGLALLDANLRVLSDQVVDVSHIFHTVEDFRLVRIADDLYLSSFDEIVPFWLWSSTSIRDGSSTTPTVLPTTVFPPLHCKDNGDKARLFASTPPWSIAIRDYTSCAPCGKVKTTSRRVASCGKNFNYFADPRSGDKNPSTSVRVEIWPSAPHIVRTVQLEKSCDRRPEPVSIVTDFDPPPSFATLEALYGPPHGEQILTRGRGGACCIDLNRTLATTRGLTTQRLLVGIQHSKSRPQTRRHANSAPRVTPNHYLSRWYAFEATEPYRIVAQSGYFCFGFPDATDNAHANSGSMLAVTTWRYLKLGDQIPIPECPRIHFVSGLTLDVRDPTKVIVAYGINDCVSGFVALTIAGVEQLLFRNVSASVKAARTKR